MEKQEKRTINRERGVAGERNEVFLKKF